ncbi:hypothetical protein MLD38_037585 [Melastoma candidum]|uniref:Uncharacterized protein n=1 Tax=Melastoma candidum TaxID=119954 RepID=A0ACB9LNH8_9MYRT|nr:hypothetical protein MLD38_037585 [Melastoma candidum]
MATAAPGVGSRRRLWRLWRPNSGKRRREVGSVGKRRGDESADRRWVSGTPGKGVRWRGGAGSRETGSPELRLRFAADVERGVTPLRGVGRRCWLLVAKKGRRLALGGVYYWTWRKGDETGRCCESSFQSSSSSRDVRGWLLRS